ncbi:MAG: cyclic nucleotide-binding domain-containing protein [Roseicyclus sp.]
MSLTSMGNIIGRHRLFAGLDPGFLDRVAGCAVDRVFAPGVHVVREGDASDRLFLLRAGHVGLDMRVPGRGAMRVATVGPDEVLGLSWLAPPHVWRYDCTTLNEVHAVEIDATCLRGQCEADPAVGYALLGRFVGPLVERLQDARLQLLDVYGPVG